MFSSSFYCLTLQTNVEIHAWQVPADISRIFCLELKGRSPSTAVFVPTVLLPLTLFLWPVSGFYFSLPWHSTKNSLSCIFKFNILKSFFCFCFKGLSLPAFCHLSSACCGYAGFRGWPQHCHCHNCGCLERDGPSLSLLPPSTSAVHLVDFICLPASLTCCFIFRASGWMPFGLSGLHPVCSAPLSAQQAAHAHPTSCLPRARGSAQETGLLREQGNQSIRRRKTWALGGRWQGSPGNHEQRLECARAAVLLGIREPS